jgi:hypothetical protein
MAIQSWVYKSLRFAKQSNLTTRNTTDAEFFAFACEVSLPKRGREKVDVDYATGQVGARKGPAVGAKQGGEISIKFPLTALKRKYDPASQAPGDTNFTTPPCAVLIANALGSRNPSATTAELFKRGANLWNETYDAAAVVSGSTTSQIELNTGLGAGILAGSLIATQDANTSALSQLGFVKSISTDSVVLEEAWKSAASNGDNVLPSATFALNGNEQLPLTIEVRGREASFVDVMVGAVCKSIKIMAESGQVPMVEMTYGVFGDMLRASTGGGVQIPDDDYQTMRPLVGAFGGRLTLGTDVGCAEKLSFDIALDVQPRLCHSATQGVTAVDTVSRTLSVAFSVARDSADNIDPQGDDGLQATFADGGTFALRVYVGSTAGAIFALGCPSLLITEEPALEDIGGRVYYGIKATAAVKSDAGDGTINDASPQNAVFAGGWA